MAITVGHVDTTGKNRTRREFEALSNYFDGLAYARENGKYGFIDHGERWVIPPSFASVTEFEAGVSVAEHDGKCGLIDARGQWTQRPEFEYLDRKARPLRLFRKDGLYGYLSPNNDIVIEPRFDEATPFSEGIASVNLDDEKMLIDIGGEVVLRHDYIYVNQFHFSLALFAANEDDSCFGFLDRRSLTPCFRLELGTNPSFFTEGLCKVEYRDEGHVFFVNSTGVKVLGPFEDADCFRNGLAPAKAGGKWGLIDQSGAFRVQPAYDRVDPPWNGYAVARVDGRRGAIDMEGRWVVPPEFDRLLGPSEGLFVWDID